MSVDKPVSEEQVRELGERNDALVKAVTKLQADLSLVQEISGIKAKSRTNRRLISALMVVTLALGGVYLKVRHNAATIKSVQCNLYSLLLSGGYHPENHLSDLGTTPQGSLDVYNHAYKQIVSDNNQLGCVLKAEEPTYVTDPSKVPSKP